MYVGDPKVKWVTHFVGSWIKRAIFSQPLRVIT